MSKFKDISEQYLDVERDPNTNEWLFLTVDNAIPIDPQTIVDSEEHWAEDAVDTLFSQMKNEFERGEFYADQVMIFKEYTIEQLFEIIAGPASLQNYYKNLKRCGIQSEGKALEPIIMAIFQHYSAGFRVEHLLKALFLKLSTDRFDKEYEKFAKGEAIINKIEKL